MMDQRCLQRRKRRLIVATPQVRIVKYTIQSNHGEHQMQQGNAFEKKKCKVRQHVTEGHVQQQDD